MNVKTILLSIALFLITCTSRAQQTTELKVVGAMKNVMWKGQLDGTLALDTISNKTNLYGLGPVEYLAGEILILDGRSYVSTVISDTMMRVEETYAVKAPFFSYATISAWTAQPLPETIQTLQHLEAYLESVTKYSSRPFLFKLTGTVEEATIHVVNLPKGSTVRSPDDAHRGQVNYTLKHEPAEMVGFFSKQHKAIFTHHDTFLHIHLMTSDKQKMGHLDEAVFRKGTMKLYLPEW